MAVSSDPRFWQPDVTVATVVMDAGRVLCIEERVDGRLVINQPAGHLEPDESLLHAAVRETLEESGWSVELTAFVGSYLWKSAPRPGEADGRHFLRFAFAARPLSHDPARRLDDGIERATWFTPAELQAQRERHRSPLVWQVVSDCLGGQRHPLSIVRHIA